MTPDPVRAALIDARDALFLAASWTVDPTRHVRLLTEARHASVVLAAEQEPERVEIADEMAKVVRVLDKAYHPQMGENRMHPLDVLVKAGAITSEQCQAALSSEAQEDQP